MSMRYWAIKWGESIRIERAYTGLHACRQAYGLCTKDMLVKDLGTQKAPLMSAKRRRELLSDANGWNTPILTTTTE